MRFNYGQIKDQTPLSKGNGYYLETDGALPEPFTWYFQKNYRKGYEHQYVFRRDVLFNWQDSGNIIMDMLERYGAEMDEYTRETYGKSIGRDAEIKRREEAAERQKRAEELQRQKEEAEANYRPETCATCKYRREYDPYLFYCQKVVDEERRTGEGLQVYGYSATNQRIKKPYTVGSVIHGSKSDWCPYSEIV